MSSPNPLTRNVRTEEYINDNFLPGDRLAVVLRNREHGQTIQRIARAEKITSPEFQAWLRHKNAHGFDIYIGMNPLKPAAFSRTKADIHEIRHLYLDIDQNGEEALAAIRRSPELPEPNYVIATSPGKQQVVWKVEGITQEQAEELLRAMARVYGGDPAATDSTRVLRLPGFHNNKYAENYRVEARLESTKLYHFSDFRVPTRDHESSPVQRDLNHVSARDSSGRSEQRTVTQSERDWAYAKRALARGDDPEEVIRKIVDYRADEKDDPEYYARLTVGKAQAEVEKSKSKSMTAGTGEAAATPSSEVEPEH